MKNNFVQAGLKEVAFRLKHLRIKKGYRTPEEFADLCDIPKAQYRNMEEGKTTITLTSLLRVLERFNMSMEDFFCSDINKLAA